MAISFFRSAATALIGRLDAGLDLADLDQRDAEPALHRLADLAGRQRERGVGDRGSMIADFVIMPRSTSAGCKPRSLARSSNEVPEARRSRAACASSMFGNTICDTSRFSGVPSCVLARSNSFLASSSETSDHLPISSGVIATKAILRYSGARNWTLCSSK